jgi:hypothetical protein
MSPGHGGEVVISMMHLTWANMRARPAMMWMMATRARPPSALPAAEGLGV